VIRIDTNSALDLQSNGEGLYIAPNLPAGDYQVVIEKQGFATYRRGPVEVRSRAEVKVDATFSSAA
jgi:hypothetical protein